MDEQYIQKVAEGDLNTFRYLVDKYKDVAFSVAFRIVQNRMVAEDIVQESFFKAYTNLHSFKGESKFSTWFYRIVTNESLKKIKRKQFTAELPFSPSMDYAGFYLNESIQSLKEEEQKRFISETLKAMQPREALVLQLFYLDEQEISEIGQILDLNADHVKVILHRARKSFYTIFTGQLKLELNALI